MTPGPSLSNSRYLPLTSSSSMLVLALSLDSYKTKTEGSEVAATDPGSVSVLQRVRLLLLHQLLELVRTWVLLLGCGGSW